MLSPSEHGIDLGRSVRGASRRYSADWRVAANAFSDGAVNKKHKKHRRFVVGGAARDVFLGKTPRDLDLLTDASWSAIKRRVACVVVGEEVQSGALLRGERAPRKRTGAFFELVSMRGEEEEEEAFRSRDGEIEAADFERRDDPREPLSAEVTYDDATVSDECALDPDVARRLRADAFRRDFTVNALAYDVESGYLYDFVGAIEDIRSRTVRTVHPSAVLSFREDPARMLRAARGARRAPHDFVLAGAYRDERAQGERALAAHGAHRETRRRAQSPAHARVQRESRRVVVDDGRARARRASPATHVAPPGGPGEPTSWRAAGGEEVFTETFPTATTEAGATSVSRIAFRGRRTGFRVRRRRARDEGRRGTRATSRGGSSTTALPPGVGPDTPLAGGKRVSDATLRRVVNEDPLFKMLRALDRRVARLGDGGACSETLAMACLAAPFAVKKLGAPSSSR